MQYDIALIQKIQEKREKLKEENIIRTTEKEEIEIFSRVLHRHLFGSST